MSFVVHLENSAIVAVQVAKEIGKLTQRCVSIALQLSREPVVCFKRHHGFMDIRGQSHTMATKLIEQHMSESDLMHNANLPLHVSIINGPHIHVITGIRRNVKNFKEWLGAYICLSH